MELTLDELRAATDGFASSRLIGSGGFGKVYAGSLEAAPLQLLNLPLAVKKAQSGRSASELQAMHREVAILRECSHAHLLPLLAYAHSCSNTAAPATPRLSCCDWLRQVLL